jgi:hypothetical protein
MGFRAHTAGDPPLPNVLTEIRYTPAIMLLAETKLSRQHKALKSLISNRPDHSAGIDRKRASKVRLTRAVKKNGR